METFRRYSMFIGGDWVDADERFEIRSPATEELVATVAKGGLEHTDRAVAAAQAGMFRMTDEKGGDDKILCVPAGDPRQEHLRDLHHLPEFDRLEIEHFFLIYKELEPGKSVEGASWAGRAAAEAEVEASRRRLRETQEPG